MAKKRSKAKSGKSKRAPPKKKARAAKPKATKKRTPSVSRKARKPVERKLATKKVVVKAVAKNATKAVAAVKTPTPASTPLSPPAVETPTTVATLKAVSTPTETPEAAAIRLTGSRNAARGRDRMKVIATPEAVMKALYDESAGTTRTVDVSKLMARTKLNTEKLDAVVEELRNIDGPVAALPQAKRGRLVYSSHGAVALGEAGIHYLKVRGLVRQ